MALDQTMPPRGSTLGPERLGQEKARYQTWVERIKARTKALEETPLPSPLWREKVKAWQEKEKEELAAQHKETTQAMKILAQETEARRKEHIYKMKRYAAIHGTGPKSTYSSAGSFDNKTR